MVTFENGENYLIRSKRLKVKAPDIFIYCGLQGNPEQQWFTALAVGNAAHFVAAHCPLPNERTS